MSSDKSKCHVTRIVLTCSSRCCHHCG